jgi:16S rRNA (uracil1498-N3)-methyltransferase
MQQDADHLKYEGGLTRLFVETPLQQGMEVVLGDQQSHYLANVLRAKAGQRIGLFNGEDGEWSAAIATITKRAVTVRVEACVREQRADPDLWLLLAPVKKTPLDYIVQKATELGVSRIVPVMTRRTIVDRVNSDRMRANAMEAAEQSERLTVPEISEPASLRQVLASWDPGRVLVFCDEAGDATDAATAFEARSATSWAILTGPEGGFEPEEREYIRSLTFSLPVTLGPRILRADTAALAAIAVWQALRGDWR